ncbi:MAG: DUF4249 domain-containing protein [Bacteroidales bacterium]|nr:DUF4249 domain-containing protein [Bacteroidales bacterium]
MQRITYYIICLLTIVCLGCQTEIEVDLPDYTSKLVIEGTIENGKPAMVVLSKSIPFFAEIDMEYIMQNVIVRDAELWVTADDGETEQLNFQFHGESPYYMAFVSPTMRGRENMGYTLRVIYHDTTYTAHTTIPSTFDLDSIWIDTAYMASEFNSDTNATVRCLLTDNPAENNYYSFSVKVRNEKFSDRLWIYTLPIAFDDQTFNGQTFNFEILRAGISSFLMPALDDEVRQDYFRISYRPGDTILVRHSLIDHDTYRFMVTGGNDAVFGSNPFTNPAPVSSNLVGENVLGNWSGFASKVDTLVWEKEE